MVLQLTIAPGFTVSGLFKENLSEFLDLTMQQICTQATLCAMVFYPKLFVRLAHFAWLYSALAFVLRWGYWHGTAVDDTTRIYRLVTL